MKKLLFLVTILCFSVCYGQQKVKEFSSENQAFIQDLGRYIRDTKKPQAKEILKSFETFWDANKLSEGQQTKFKEIANQLLKKRYFAYPHFTYLMQATQLAVDSQKVQTTTLDTLLYTFGKVIEIQKRPQYETFCRTVIPFLKDQSINTNTAQHIRANGEFLIVWREEVIPVYEEEEEEYEEDSFDEEYSDEYVDREDYMSAEDAWESEDDEYGDFEDWDQSYEEDEEDWYSEDYDDGSWEDEESWESEEDDDNYEETYEEEPVRIGYIAPELPIIKGPVIEFPAVDFELETRYDTTKIVQTKATLLILDKKVVAEGGTFDWTSAGLSQDVKGTFKQFIFSSNRIALEAEGFELQYPSKIDSTVEGIFKFVSTKHSKPEHAKYPRFMSYNADISLKGLCEGIKYTGGFSLEGQKIHSSCVSLARSKIEVFGNPGSLKSIPSESDSTVSLELDSSSVDPTTNYTSTNSENQIKLFVAKAKFFDLTEGSITSHPTAVTIYFGEDSITHPSVRLKFNCASGDLQLFKNKSIYRNTPFKDSYHAMEIDVDAIKWNIKDTSIYFRTVSGKQHVTSYFSSINYFSKKRFSHLKGLYPFHPLTMLVAYSRKNGDTRKIYLNQLQEFSNQKKSTLDNSMKLLMRNGYIEYNGDEIKLTDKTFFFVSSNAMDIDYDVIIIPSINPSKYNGELNLNNQLLTVYGVDSVYFSDSLDVNFHPRGRKIVVHKNRKFTFDGSVNTSIYNFNGRDFTFDYEKFNLDLIQIDSIKFTIDETDTVTGRSKGEKQIDNKLSYSSGTLYIDSSINKSGKERYARYPFFDANRGAYVYFDQPDVLGGVYDTTVHFKIPPFGSDSMSSKSDAVNFDGAFHSGGIFPVFDEKLGVMEDYSFGFVHPTPDTGYQLYNGHGNFKGTIRLDKEGIRGNGVITFLNTTIESEDFIFFTDSLTTVGNKSFTLKGKTKELNDSITFPDVYIADYEVKWYPKKDSMLINNLISPFYLYDSTATLTGQLNVTHNGLNGQGIIEQKGSRTVAPLFHFEESILTGRNAEFEILSNVEGKPAVKSDFVKVAFDLDSGFATFGPEQKGFASNEFPYLQYKTSIDQGVWDINKRIVTMSSSDTTEESSSYFYSTHPDQDSLVFTAGGAIYSMDSLSLHVTGIPYITVADGKIIPNQKELFIKENAKILPLENAEIIMDTLNEFHHLIKGNLEIDSRNKFKGSAYYNYVNLEGDSLLIKFNSFDLEEYQISKNKTEYHTVCHGEVLAEDTFLFGPKMYYKGDATMYASERLLALNGEIRLDMNGELDAPGWFAYYKRDSIEQIFLKTDSFRSKSKKKTYTGINYSYALRDYYPTMLGVRGGKKDYSVFQTKGVLTYDTTNHEFRVGDSLKIIGQAYEGELFAYNEEKETVRIEGILDLFGHPEPGEDGTIPEDTRPVQLKVSAEGDLHIVDSLFEVNGLTFLTMEMDGKALDQVGLNLEQMSAIYGAERAFYFNDTLAYEIADIAGEKAAQNFRENPDLPLPKIVKDFSKGFVLTNVHLEWDQVHKVWFSKHKFGIGSVGKHQVNALVDGYIEVKKKKKFDYTVKVYFKLAENVWYYFAYEKNKLLTVSSNPVYNNIISDKSTKARNEPIGQYYFDLASTKHPGKFEKYFKQTYWGEKGDDFDDFDFNFEEEIIDTLANDTLGLDSLNFSETDSLNLNTLDSTFTDEPELDQESEEEELEDQVTEEDEEAMFDELEDEDAGLEDLEALSDEDDSDFDEFEDDTLNDPDNSQIDNDLEEESPKEKKKKRKKDK